MKKLFALLLALVMVFALAACGPKNPSPGPANNPDTESAAPSRPAAPSESAGSGEDDEADKSHEQLIAEIEKLADQRIPWQQFVLYVVKKYDPAVRNQDTIFYGASNFTQWMSMEEDLAPYDVQNHAFGGSADKDLEIWAPYLLYPYQPKIVFFQTGSNDYVQSDAETDELKVEEAMNFKKQMFAEIHEHLPDAQFVVMSGILLPGRTEYVDLTLKINDLLKVYCEETDYMTFIDAESLTYDRTTGSFVKDVESLFEEDQIHLTKEARITWAKEWIIPALEALGAPKSAE